MLTKGTGASSCPAHNTRPREVVATTSCTPCYAMHTSHPSVDALHASASLIRGFPPPVPDRPQRRHLSPSMEPAPEVAGAAAAAGCMPRATLGFSSSTAIWERLVRFWGPSLCAKGRSTASRGLGSVHPHPHVAAAPPMCLCILMQAFRDLTCRSITAQCLSLAGPQLGPQLRLVHGPLGRGPLTQLLAMLGGQRLRARHVPGLFTP